VAIDREVRYVDVGAHGFRQAMAGAGLPDWLVDALVDGNVRLAAGEGATVTDEFARVTGHRPRTFARFAADHRVAFAGRPAASGGAVAGAR
jgi:hypothetical protein